ncbi:hypothetical protein ONW95_004961 [Salmonella enterica]|nr:hypothetical protein [Salmonella enterica]EDC2516607.1 hypothetical protein [Salmonella enterica]EFO9572512.1 hypothetical protein [Salmonella enterica]EGA6593297.1 hypothetical protein [Salmonella enterica]EHF0280776.1 hypothetical protein [Salmonella enterica]
MKKETVFLLNTHAVPDNYSKIRLDDNSLDIITGKTGKGKKTVMTTGLITASDRITETEDLSEIPFKHHTRKNR